MSENEFYDDGTPGPSIEGEEFMEMMASRGLILPRPPTFGERLYHAAGAPFRALRRVGGWIAWKLWGKRYHKRSLEKEIKRMKQLAGIGSPEGGPLYGRPQLVGHLDKGRAAETLEHIRETHVVREELPKPDYDDSGLN